MDKKPKTGGAPRKAKEQKIEDIEQSERFVETARNLGADESGQGFERIASRIFIPKRTNKAQE